MDNKNESLGEFNKKDYIAHEVGKTIVVNKFSGIRAPKDKFIVINKEVQTSLGDFMMSEDGVDNNVDGEVIAVGKNITDVKKGNIITYPSSRGVKAFYEEQEIRVVDYGSMIYFV